MNDFIIRAAITKGLNIASLTLDMHNKIDEYVTAVLCEFTTVERAKIALRIKIAKLRAESVPTLTSVVREY